MNDHNLLKKALIENGWQLTPHQHNQLLKFLELLQQWNKVFNLTAITNFRDMVYLHLIDSLSIAPYLKGERFLDVGSGGGFPGIPLAILYPNQHWVLLDKTAKKIRFLTQVIVDLKLSNVEAVNDRVENYAPTADFDGVTARAFGDLHTLFACTKHLLNKDGCVYAMKGQYPLEELSSLSEEQTQVIALKLFGIEQTRHLVCIHPQ